MIEIEMFVVYEKALFHECHTCKSKLIMMVWMRNDDKNILLMKITLFLV